MAAVGDGGVTPVFEKLYFSSVGLGRGNTAQANMEVTPFL